MSLLPNAGRALAALAVVTLLSACAVTSKTPLIDAGEATAAPLDQTATVQFYEEQEGNAGVFAKAEDGEPQTFNFKDGAYQATDGSMIVRFAPRTAENSYTIILDIQGANLYGVATVLPNHVLEMHLVLGDNDVPAIKAKLAADPALAATVTADEGGIGVADRKGLDIMLGLIEAGEIAAKPMVAYVSSGEGGAFPATIKAEAGGWVTAD
jgi:hypothetical protein